MKTVIAFPAYGRDYKNKEAVLKDWNDNKDFQISGGGPYVNKQDAEENGLSVIIYYDKGRKAITV